MIHDIKGALLGSRYLLNPYWKPFIWILILGPNVINPAFQSSIVTDGAEL